MSFLENYPVRRQACSFLIRQKGHRLKHLNLILAAARSRVNAPTYNQMKNDEKGGVHQYRPYPANPELPPNGTPAAVAQWGLPLGLADRVPNLFFYLDCVLVARSRSLHTDYCYQLRIEL
jgi:hypothetical protein